MSSQWIPVLFGTETGNAEACAQALAQELTEIGFTAKAVDMLEFPLESLPQQTFLFIITSTTGDGEAPDNAAELLDHLQNSGVRLPELFFGVCGLGDTDYDMFAQCGKDFDAALEACGAQRAVPRMDCDVEYQAAFNTFVQQVQGWLLE